MYIPNIENAINAHAGKYITEIPIKTQIIVINAVIANAMNVLINLRFIVILINR